MSESRPTASADRLLPERALPPYSYVTGKFPHPVRDVTGHQFGQSVPVEDPLNPNAWRHSESYRFGIDLWCRLNDLFIHFIISSERVRIKFLYLSVPILNDS